MLHENRRRAESFGEDPLQYDRARPGYPPSLIDDLVPPGVARVLDVGCGTGIAARLMAARGCQVRGVEPDPRMAAVARAHGLTVDVSRFEDWQWGGEPFDLITAAQSWHWVDPAVGVHKAGQLLRPGGRFAAFWNGHRFPPDLRAALRPIYERHAPHLLPELQPRGSGPDDTTARGGIPDLDALRDCGLFHLAEERRYAWTRECTRARWLDDLATHSSHRTLDPERRAALLTGIGAVIDDLGGALLLHYQTRLITAVRRS